MKRQYIYTLLFLLAIPFASCEKLPINGRLDGMWKLQKMTDTHMNTKHPEGIFYSIQLNLIKLSKINNSGTPEKTSELYLGRFQYTPDSLILSDFHTWVYREEEIPATPEQLAPFGFTETDARFGIEKLSKEEMILKSKDFLLIFEKF